MNNNTNKIFEYIEELLLELSKTNSSNEKKTILKKYHKINPECFDKLMEYTYSYKKQYYITSKNIDKNIHMLSNNHQTGNIFDLLDILNERIRTGHQAIEWVNNYVRDNGYREIIYKIIDRDLKVGVGRTLINKVSNCIPVFKVALAEKYDEKSFDKVDMNDFTISHKIDGVRCIAIVDEHSNSKFFSRSGKEFLTLDKVSEDIKKHGIKNCVLDGELCIVNSSDGKEDFQAIMKEIRRKDHVIESPVYKVFDKLTHEEFNSQESLRTFWERYKYDLIPLFTNEDKSQKQFNVLQLVIQHQMKEFELLKKQSLDNGWEGLMLRNAQKGYKGKRSKDILKYKLMQDAEYSIIGVEESKKAFLIDGVKKELPCIGNLIIEHKGNKVGVGSGLSDDQKRYWLEHPEDIIGKVVTIQYFEETTDQNGNYSLRFPVLKVVHGTEREV